ncbi:Unknown protein sequence [Pseudomonas amygdali pv. sesami]|nr:Unknown protein sequence [Pseudomonas amygdali pv. sesami]
MSEMEKVSACTSGTLNNRQNDRSRREEIIKPFPESGDKGI